MCDEQAGSQKRKSLEKTTVAVEFFPPSGSGVWKQWRKEFKEHCDNQHRLVCEIVGEERINNRNRKHQSEPTVSWQKEKTTSI